MNEINGFKFRYEVNKLFTFPVSVYFVVYLLVNPHFFLSLSIEVITLEFVISNSFRV